MYTSSHAQSNKELKRRLAAVDCQLRKEQKVVRRYEVATEKLLQFVEVTTKNEPQPSTVNQFNTLCTELS